MRVYEQLFAASKSESSIPGSPPAFPTSTGPSWAWNRSDLILIASRPGMGKTSIALNIALHVAKNSGKTVAMFSLEMSREQLALRLIAGESYVDGKKLQRGDLTENDWLNVTAAVKTISEASLLINDNPSLTVADMNAQCRRVPDLGLVVIDYLQLMTSATGTANYGRNPHPLGQVSGHQPDAEEHGEGARTCPFCACPSQRANEGRTNKAPSSPTCGNPAPSN